MSDAKDALVKAVRGAGGDGPFILIVRKSADDAFFLTYEVPPELVPSILRNSADAAERELKARRKN